AGGAVAVSVVYRTASPNPYSSGMAAAVVLGRPNLFAAPVPAGTPPSASSLAGPPAALAFDAAGDLWVADPAANRVLEYEPPFEDGMPASRVLGQQSFAGDAPGTSAQNLSFPDGLALDPQGDLWVADGGNDRVVEFVPPFHTGMAATVAIGQTSLAAAAPGSGADGMGVPGGIGF
ncbi:NHL repeat containing protein, partial [mine drainage metagenome]